VSGSTPTDAATAQFERVLQRLPFRLRTVVGRLLDQWPGRIGLGVAATSIRIELFDRSMTIAAQFFTSVFPILIVLASWLGSGGTQLADALAVPDETEEVLEKALGSTPDYATFGVVGTLIVLASATSLSRALTRAFAAIWDQPRPHIKLTSAWRWLTVVLALALAILTARALSRFVSDIPPPTLWEASATFSFDVLIGVFIPWLLMAGQVSPRRLLPGALVFAAVMIFVRPASGAWLPRALELSADRYGAIGVAFTYLAWLYVVSFCFLAANVLGKVLAMDPGWLGRLIRGEAPSGTSVSVS
jgi:membrane protein